MVKRFFPAGLLFISLQTVAQAYKLPAYPLVVHDPYFSIWSFSDKLNESVTRHWTGADHSLIGLLKVDGKIYKFLGSVENKMNPLLPDADAGVYSCRYTESKPTADWISLNYDDTKWEAGQGMFSTKDAGGKTEWNTREIWIRREFSLSDIKVHELVLRLKYDDNVEVYLNGYRIFTDGCCSSNKELVLTKTIEKKLRAGKNVLAVYCENTGGPGLIDAGLYERLPPQPISQAIQNSREITATQTKYDFTCGPVSLGLDFLSPLIASDPDLLSRPVSYISFEARALDNRRHDVRIYLMTSDAIAKNTKGEEVKKEIGSTGDLSFIKTGTSAQPVLQWLCSCDEITWNRTKDPGLHSGNRSSGYEPDQDRPGKGRKGSCVTNRPAGL
jgi:hypothetical protein